MRHGFSKRRLNMNTSQRMAVLRNLAISLIKTGKVMTTLAKAKELRSFVEPLITKAKIDNLHKKRLIISSLGTDSVLSEILSIGQKMLDRKGGYTRIVKNGNRYGDYAQTAVIELV